MDIQTKYQGIRKVEEKEIINFAKGIPGFPEEKQFILMPLNEENIFSVLQSVQSPEVAFVVTNPFAFFQEYEFTLDESTLTFLDIHSEQEVEIFVILTINQTFEQSTANLLAPVIINRRNQQGKQIILHESPYKTKTALFQKTEIKG